MVLGSSGPPSWPGRHLQRIKLFREEIKRPRRGSTLQGNGGGALVILSRTWLEKNVSNYHSPAWRRERNHEGTKATKEKIFLLQDA